MLNENSLSIRKQTIEINVESEEIAISLQSKISHINRLKLVPLINKAMKAENRKGKHIRLKKLDIDLGWVPFDEFEEVVERRFERMLAQQLKKTVEGLLKEDRNKSSQNNKLIHKLDKQRHDIEEGNILESAESKIKILEYYLITGTLPWKVHERSKFDFEKSFIELMVRDGSTVINLIRTSSQKKYVVERLVMQLKQHSLQKLLYLLEPKHGWLIFSYITDLKSLYVIKPILPINKQTFSRLLWVLTLSYSVKEHGSQFNRQSFVKTLLKSMARSEGLQYISLLEALNLGMQKHSKNSSLQSSLPALIAKLIEEHNKEKGEKELTFGSGKGFNKQYSYSSLQVGDLFKSYDREKTIDFFLRCAVLPWQVIWRQPNSTVSQYLAGLKELPSNRLKALLKCENIEEQIDILHRLVKRLKNNDLIKIFERLLPIGFSDKSEFGKVVVLSLQSTKNRDGLCVSLLVSLLHDKNIVLEQNEAFKLDNKVGGMSHSVTAWNYHQLQSELVKRLKDSTYSKTKSPRSHEIVDMLLDRYPSESKNFIIELNDLPNLTKELVVQCEEITFHKIIILLQPAEHGIFEILMTSLESIPMPYRPDINLLRQVTLREAISLKHPIRNDFFTRILSQVFHGSLSKTLGKHLLKSVADLSSNNKIVDSMKSSYRDAILSCSIQKNKKHAENGESSSTHKVIKLISSEAEINQFRQTDTFYDEEQGLQKQHIQRQVFRFLSGEISDNELLINQSEIAEQNSSSLRLENLIIQCFENSKNTLTQFLKRYIKQQKIREIWLNKLSEGIMARLVWLLDPNSELPLFQDAEILSTAYSETMAVSGHNQITRTELWRFILLFYANNQDSALNLNKMLSHFFTYFYSKLSPSGIELSRSKHSEAKKIGIELNLSKNKHHTNDSVISNVEGKENILHEFIERAISIAKKTSRNRLRNSLLQEKEKLLSLWLNDKNSLTKTSFNEQTNINRSLLKRRESLTEQKVHSAFKKENRLYKDEGVYVENAGLILVAVFLPHLFHSLDMLKTLEKGKKRLSDPEAFSRAVHLLQYLVDGSTSTTEPLLILNKILCGEPPETCVESLIDMSEKERSICHQLHQAMLSRWECLSNTTIDGLQQTFLQREGRLEKSDDGWILTIQRKTVDVLVDQVPWRISVISEAWMPEPIFVKW